MWWSIDRVEIDRSAKPKFRFRGIALGSDHSRKLWHRQRKRSTRCKLKFFSKAPGGAARSPVALTAVSLRLRSCYKFVGDWSRGPGLSIHWSYVHGTGRKNQ